MHDTEKLSAITEAIRNYHFALDQQQQNNSAARECVQQIEAVLDLPWFPGAEVERRGK